MVLSSKKNINRLVIYFFYDKDGIVDDYVTYMLQDLKKNSNEILFVCNGKLSSNGRKKVEKYTSNIYVRENEGFDVWAYKEAIDVISWEKMYMYDEVVFMNFTIMGPIYPFENMFKKMNSEDVDFWGITEHHKLDFDPFGTVKFGYIPRHIQSHFICVRNKMLKSREFKEYWMNMKKVTRYEEAVGYHEAIFTKHFEDKGFNWKVYIDTSDLEEHSYYPLLLSPKTLIKDKLCPIFKRRSFFHDYNNFLNLSNGEASYELMEFLRNNTDYDTDLIWANILRAQSMAAIKNSLHLNYILPTDSVSNKESSSKNKKIAIIVHMYFEDLVNECIRYIKSVPETADVFITTDTKNKKEKIEKACSQSGLKRAKVILIENRGRDVSALLVGAKTFVNDYDLVCFAHDKKVTQLKPAIKGEGFAYKCFENILKSKEFVENIINTFDKNPRLGMLMPPPPNFSDYYPTTGNEWSCNYDITKKIYDDLELTVSISEEDEPIAPLGTMFWFRPDALKKLFDEDWEYDDFPKEPNGTDGTVLHGIERIYPFVVQEEGYYPAWVLAETFAKVEFTNMNFMLREINKVAFQEYGFNSHYGLISTMKYRLNHKNNSNEEYIDSDHILRMLIKNKIKRKTPKVIWNPLKWMYKLFRGKKWVG